MANKITKKEMFAMIMKVEGVAQNPEMVEFLAHEIKLLERKASKSGSTKTQKANAELMPRIIESLAMVGKPVTSYFSVPTDTKEVDGEEVEE